MSEIRALDSHDPANWMKANKWVVALTVVFGAFMAVMDTTVVNVAMPHMMGTFGQDLSAITWVATGYSIAEIIMVTMAAWWSAVLGRKRLYLLSFALFTVGSILCGTSTNFTQMIIYRVIQGIGGGSLIPISQAILRESFPQEEQGMAMAVYGMAVVIAPAVGPILGGWLTDNYGWQWIFYINVPVSIVGMMLVMAYVQDPPYLVRGVKSIDWQGIALLTVCLTGLQVVLERGQEDNWFQSQFIVWGPVITVVAALALIFWELRAREPIVPIRLLRNVPLSMGSIIGLVFGVGLFGTTFILPQFTQELLGYPAFQSGLILAPRALTLLLMMPVAGWAYRYVDPRILVLIGMAIIAWTYYDLSRLSMEAGFWTIVPALLLMGAGMPFMFVTLSTVALSTVRREEMTAASSLYTLARRVGGNLGYAMAATLIARGTQVQRTHLVNRVGWSMQWEQFKSHMSAALQSRGVPLSQAAHAVLAVANRMINQQARMMAYNSLSIILGLTFVLVLPLILFLPGRMRGGKVEPAVAE
ncbi:MAG TPA: DHA2 family efflux MFS transporter permease subunit [Tepidisphaeraceae bacterium]|nr:DHA2 family efflux MFS transporter permease subunit [Tepidisphaeraceae bacterium]